MVVVFLIVIGDIRVIILKNGIVNEIDDTNTGTSIKSYIFQRIGTFLGR